MSWAKSSLALLVALHTLVNGVQVAKLQPFLNRLGWSERLSTLTGTPLCRSTRAFPTRRLEVVFDSRIPHVVEWAGLSSFPGMITSELAGIVMSDEVITR